MPGNKTTPTALHVPGVHVRLVCVCVGVSWAVRECSLQPNNTEGELPARAQAGYRCMMELLVYSPKGKEKKVLTEQ